MLTLLIEAGKSQKKVIGHARVREVAKMSLARVGPVVTAWKAGEMPDIMHSWDDDALVEEEAGPRELLGELIASAQTDEERERVAHEMARLIALSKLSPDDAKEIRASLAEARHSAKNARDQPTEDPEKVYLVSPDGALLIRAFERICGDARREKILTLAQGMLKEDIQLMPSVDPVGAL